MPSTLRTVPINTVIDRLMQQAEAAKEINTFRVSRELHCTAASFAVEMGASKSKIDSLMRYYTDRLALSLLNPYLCLTVLAPKASRKAREAALQAIIAAVYCHYSYAENFAKKYLNRRLNEAEVMNIIDGYCRGEASSDVERGLINWAAKISPELAIAARKKITKRNEASRNLFD